MAVIRDKLGPEDLVGRLENPARPEWVEIPARRCVGNTEPVGKAGHLKDLAVREDLGSPVPPDKEEMMASPALYRLKLAAVAVTEVEEARAVTLTTGYSTYLTMVVRPGSYTIHGTPGVGKFPFNPIVRTGRT